MILNFFPFSVVCVRSEGVQNVFIFDLKHVQMKTANGNYCFSIIIGATTSPFKMSVQLKLLRQINEKLKRG